LVFSFYINTRGLTSNYVDIMMFIFTYKV